MPKLSQLNIPKGRVIAIPSTFVLEKKNPKSPEYRLKGRHPLNLERFE